jgi:hypothetical protein
LSGNVASEEDLDDLWGGGQKADYDNFLIFLEAPSMTISNYTTSEEAIQHLFPYCRKKPFGACD